MDRYSKDLAGSLEHSYSIYDIDDNDDGDGAKGWTLTRLTWGPRNLILVTEILGFWHVANENICTQEDHLLVLRQMMAFSYLFLLTCIVTSL